MSQQINFTEKLQEYNDLTKFFIAEEQQKTILSNGTSKTLNLLNNVQMILNLWQENGLLPMINQMRIVV